jgi:predicted DNA-binding protein with PD1-like motif
MELADKDIKAAIVNVLHMFKEVEVNTNVLRRETEVIYEKETQIELLGLKNTVPEMKI